jgi:hypothetical protein
MGLKNDPQPLNPLLLCIDEATRAIEFRHLNGKRSVVPCYPIDKFPCMSVVFKLMVRECGEAWNAKAAAAPATVNGESSGTMPLGKFLGRRRKVVTREPGNLPSERSRESMSVGVYWQIPAMRSVVLSWWSFVRVT